jgi:nucleoside-diphosphate-sugar epimerase
MRVFVLGGTGAIGGHVIPALVGHGHTVTALARTPAKAATLAAQGATTVSVSIFNPSALAAVFAGQDAVVNLTSAIPPMTRFVRASTWRDNDRVRTQGSAAVVDAAIDAGVGRLLQESVSMLYRDNGSGWIDERMPTELFPRSAANLAAEANANRFTAAGGTGVVLRFGWFYGPGATHSEQLLALTRRHIGVVLGRPEGYVSSIHVADGATAVAAALQVPGGTFNVVDDEPLTKRDYAAAMAAAVGTALWLRVPGRAGLLAGDRLTSLTRSLRVSNARFRSATGWAPRYPSARQGWIATAHQLDRRARQRSIAS